MKKRMVIAMCIVAAMTGLAACGSAKEKTTTSSISEVADSTAESAIGMPNPIIEYNTMDEAEKACGFGMNPPETIEGYNKKVISVINAATLQVEYEGADGQSITIRKAIVEGDGSADISGVYTEYPIETTNTLSENRQITIRGDEELSYVATKTSGGYAYSIYASSGMDSNDMVAILLNL